MENLGSDTLSYSMKAVLLRPDTAEQDGKTMVLASDVLIREVDLGSVSVPAGGTQGSRTISLTASDIAAIRDLFPNGSYVEGFVILTAADGSAPQIGMPGRLDLCPHPGPRQLVRRAPGRRKRDEQRLYPGRQRGGQYHPQRRGSGELPEPGPEHL